MKNYAFLLLAPTLLFFCASCSTVPLTGRTQFRLVPESQMVSLATAQYVEVKKTTPISKNATQTTMVKNAGKRITAAVEKYLRDNNMADRIETFSWEFNLFESKEVNAWAMPGGKIAFYTGIMDICKNETGVAVVMSHEIGHVVARHGAERYSQQIMAQAGASALSLVLNDSTPTTRNALLGAYGAGANYGIILPFSRKHEYEADKLGILFMAMAGYDPREAVEFWTRMKDLSGGAKPPELLSTHPSDANRIKKLEEELPGAMRYYQKR